jgi:hypothetical protein
MTFDVPFEMTPLIAWIHLAISLHDHSSQKALPLVFSNNNSK